MSSREHKEKIWDLIKDMKVGMLTTQVEDSLHARPMHLCQDDYDGHIYFFTNTDSDKNFEIDKESKVCVTFADAGEQIFVSLTGTANIRKDQALIDKLWNPMIGTWYPEGKHSDQIAILDIHVELGEHWDGESSKIMQAFALGKAKIKSEKPDLGENEKFGQL